MNPRQAVWGGLLQPAGIPVNFTTLKTAILILLLFPFQPAWPSDDLSDLLARVARINISRQGYVLGKKLTKEQKATALNNPEEAANSRTRKFRDGALHVVTDKTTGRVVVIYEQYEAITVKKAQALVGAFSLEFGDPTVMAHHKTIYWAFGSEGKVTRSRYEKAKRTGEKLNILAMVKLDSSMEIVGNSALSDKGNVYYIISSEPALKLMKKE